MEAEVYLNAKMTFEESIPMPMYGKPMSVTVPLTQEKTFNNGSKLISFFDFLTLVQRKTRMKALTDTFIRVRPNERSLIFTNL